MNDNRANKNFGTKVVILAGGFALLGAMAIDTLAVIGRHTGLALHGSIELIQAALLISGIAALIVATLAGTHAIVRLLIDHAPARIRIWMVRSNHILSALFFLTLLIANVWISADMWLGHEASELLGVPYRPLRIMANLGLAVVTVVFLRQAFRQPAK